MRHSQLDLRLAEFSHALSVLKMINAGSNIENLSILAPHWDWSRWKGAMDTERIIIAGHSLGGTAAVSTSTLYSMLRTSLSGTRFGFR